MSFETGPEVRVLQEPDAMRALAHPLRIQLLELLGRNGSMTGAAAGRALGVSQALASHHLRQLAKHGFIERVAGTDDRERPWRRVHSSIFWPREGDEDTQDTVDLLEQLWFQRASRNLETWQRLRNEAPPGWSAVSGLTQNLVYVTADEAQQLMTAIGELITAYVARHRIGDLEARPEGSMPFDITTVAVPRVPTSNGG